MSPPQRVAVVSRVELYTFYILVEEGTFKIPDRNWCQDDTRSFRNTTQNLQSHAALFVVYVK